MPQTSEGKTPDHKDTMGDGEPDALTRLTTVDREGVAPPAFATETGEPHFARGHSPAQEKMDSEDLSQKEREFRGAAQPPTH